MTSTLLLAIDEIALFAPDIADDHGWVLPPEPIPVWAGNGSVQLAFGTAASGNDSGGGAGPFRPQTTLAGALFLPLDAQPREGMVADVANRGRYVISSCRWIPDPSGGDLGCWTANLETLGKVD